MNVNYNNFAKTFSESRKNMKWEELEYFFWIMNRQATILDVWCGSGRFLQQYKKHFWVFPQDYLWVDLSSWLLEEAKKSFPQVSFMQADMLELEEVLWWKKFENIFFIASFHHLDTIEKREKVLRKLYDFLSPEGKIYMTNWALESSLNKDKYADSKREGSENKFNSSDFDIKIWSSQRYYHSFSLSELEYLAKNTGFDILENRVFDSERNIITIFKK